jgi:predicted nucleotidyltransferase
MAALRLSLAGRASSRSLDPAWPCAARRSGLYHHLVDVGGDVNESPGSLKLAIGQDALDEFCARHHIRRISLFGSVLRGEERPDSDIDLLVEFEPGQTPGYIALAGMEAELSDLLGGRTVDMRTRADLSRYFRDDVMREAELQHAR